MIDPGAELSVTRQCELLGLNRTGVYYTPRPVREEDLRIMRRIDELHLEHPFYGARRLAKQLEREGFGVGRVHVATLMRRMGIEALYRRPRTSIPARDAKIYLRAYENGRELQAGYLGVVDASSRMVRDRKASLGPEVEPIFQRLALNQSDVEATIAKLFHPRHRIANFALGFAAWTVSRLGVDTGPKRSNRNWCH
jgi:HTH-like domain